MRTPEGRVKDEIKRHLKALGAYWFMPVQSGFGASTLDFLVCLNGRFIGIETKRAGVHEPSARQKIVMEQIEAAGGIAILAQSWEDVARHLP